MRVNFFRMVSLAIWIAAVMFLAYVGFIGLGLLVGLFKAAMRPAGVSRVLRQRPKGVRTMRDSAILVGIVIAALIMIGLVVYSTTL